MTDAPTIRAVAHPGGELCLRSKPSRKCVKSDYYDLNSIPYKKKAVAALRQKQKVLSSFRCKPAQHSCMCTSPTRWPQPLCSACQVAEQYEATSMLGPAAINGIVKGRTRPEREKEYFIRPGARAVSFVLVDWPFGLQLPQKTWMQFVCVLTYHTDQHTEPIFRHPTDAILPLPYRV